MKRRVHFTFLSQRASGGEMRYEKFYGKKTWSRVPTAWNMLRLRWERPLQRQGIDEVIRTCEGLYCEIQMN